MHSQLSPWACTSTDGYPIESSGSHQGKCSRTNSHELRAGPGTNTEQNSSWRSRGDQRVLVLGVGLEGVERRLLARDGVINERKAAGAGPRVGLLLPLRQLVPRLRAPPPPAAGVLPGWFPQKEGALLLPAALAAVGGALGTRDARLIRRRRSRGGRAFALLRHQVVRNCWLERPK